jgi:nucleoside-diphosphate-sugar epimerase
MEVLIAGCGYVGTELGLRLARDGATVWGLRRRAHRLPPPIRPLAADLLAADLSSRLPAATHVVYAASAGASTDEGYRTAYVEGPDRLLDGLATRGIEPERFVFVSSTGVYGDAEGEEVDEAIPVQPEGFRGSRLREGERRVEERLPGSALILRLGGIYGPGRTRLLERVRSGEARCPADGPIWTNRIHRDDAARAIQHLLHLPSPSHSLFLGVDTEPAPLCEVYRFVARLLDASPPTVDDSVTRRRSNKRCSSRRLQRTGFDFDFPTYREGYRALVADVRPPTS